MKKFIAPIALLTLSFNAHALVDYSEAPAASSSSSSDNKSSAKVSAPSRSDSKSLIWKSDFSFNANYEVQEVEAQKIGAVNLNTHVQTPFNIYLDLTYWQAHNTAGSQKGNPKGIIGFNWLRFGSPSDEARLNAYGGAKLSSSSALASSRTDKIFGAETTKRFGTFGLGLGYDVTMTGNPHTSADMSIGNIQRISVSGGWMVSNDIQFELELESFKINKSDSGNANSLNSGISFSCLSPKLNLNLAPGIGLEMGARFRTNKPKTNQDLGTAKLFDLHGAYSNSLFAGLNLNL